MSEKYPGGFITRTPPTPTNSLSTTPAPGIWTREQVAQLIQAGTWPNPANLAVEAVFNTFTYTGNGSTQTINNGINLSGQGGLVWLKSRSPTGYNHQLYDTVRGAQKPLFSNLTNAEGTQSNGLTSFTSSGFNLGSFIGINESAGAVVAWTFREAPGFFDIVTYTGNGSTATRAINHNLGVAPGMIIVKRLDQASQWKVTHFNPSAKYGRLNSTDDMSSSNFANLNGGYIVGFATATQFNVAEFSGVSDTNANGGTYVAYLFAHNTTADGIIQCGSYTGTGVVGNTITLGWEPQWLLVKNATTGGQEWGIFDSMRGLAANSSGGDAQLFANDSSTEGNSFYFAPTATGFSCEDTSLRYNASGNTYAYVAIRRGLMAAPTVGTTVFSPIAAVGNEGDVLTTGIPFDLQINSIRTGGGYNSGVFDRLRGVVTTNTTASAPKLTTSSAASETNVNATRGWNSTGFSISQTLGSSTSMIYWNFRRAAGFFDTVCYTGNSTSGRTVNHNLTVVPELTIIKARNWASGDWFVLLPNTATTYNRLIIDGTFGQSTYDYSPSTGGFDFTAAPTATQLTLGSSANTNSSSYNYVAHLFASCPGVSKVGTYTGTGALQTINCGFTTGARFVLIKRTDTTGDWYVYDSARGISSGNDPFTLLNTTSAETTGTNYVDTTSVGFQVTAAAPAGLNASGGTYLFLAIS